MDKKFLLRFGLIFAIFAVILGASYGCTIISQEKQDTPEIDNPNNVYATIGGYEITNQMLWDEMKNAEGYDYLLQYIDEMILESYIDEVTDEEIAQEVEFLTYQTKDQELIDEIKADPELDAEFIEVYRAKMILAGFNPDSAEDLRASFELGIAKYNYAKDYILNAEEDDALAVTADDIREHYEENYLGDACVVPVRLNSQQEGEDLLDEFLLVPNYNTTMVGYIGSDPIEDVSSDNFNDTNTVSFTDSELFSKFIELYNYQNPWAEQIDPSIDESIYCSTYADFAMLNYKEMTDGKGIGNTEWDYAFNVFNILQIDNDARQRYTYRIQSFGDEQMLVYLVNHTPDEPYESLTNVFVDEIYNELVEAKLGSAAIQQIINDARSEEIEIFDPMMKLTRKVYAGEEFENEGSKTVYATYGDLEITAQDLFEYMTSKAGTRYALELGKRQMVLNSPLFEEKYGTDKDYINSKNEAVEPLVEQLQAFKSNYSNGQVGVDPTEVTWKELLALNFGTDDENEVIELVLMFPSLIPDYVHANLHDFELATDVVQDEFDNYYSLNTTHLLIYLDLDNDFAPDDYSDFVDGLTTEEMTEYNLLKAEFENLLDERINDEIPFEEIVDEFEDGLVGDIHNPWRNVKAYGFRMKTETLPAINHNSSSTLDDDFKADVIELYEEYLRDENAESEFLFHYSLTTSDFGVHKIRATKPVDFTKPTAVFSEVDAENPAFSEGSENENELPSLAQFLLYTEIYHAEQTQSETELSLPSNVRAALDFYYGPIIQAQYSQSGYGLLTLEILLSNDDIEFTENNDEILAKLEQQLEAYYFNTFPEEYVTASE